MPNSFKTYFEESNYYNDTLHPQFWDENLDYENKKVAVIGSGATAITIVPEIAKKARHVVMIQRSPSYVVSRPRVDSINKFLSKFLPQRFTYF